MKKYLYIFYTCLYLRKTHYITLYTNKTWNTSQKMMINKNTQGSSSTTQIYANQKFKKINPDPVPVALN